MLSTKVFENTVSAAPALAGCTLELVDVSAAPAANAPHISRDRAIQRRQRRQRRQARASQRTSSGWSVGLW